MTEEELRRTMMRSPIAKTRLVGAAFNSQGDISAEEVHFELADGTTLIFKAQEYIGGADITFHLKG